MVGRAGVWWVQALGLHGCELPMHEVRCAWRGLRVCARLRCGLELVE